MGYRINLVVLSIQALKGIVMTDIYSAKVIVIHLRS